MPRSRGHLPRLADVARKAGVSIATASRALAGADGVSAEAADRVRKVAADIGYVMNTHARSLAKGSSSSVGLIVHEIGDPYFTEIASGVIGLATEHGLSVQISHSGRDPLVELSLVRALIADRAASIILAGSSHVDPNVGATMHEELARFRAEGGGVASIGRHRRAIDAVLPDNRNAGRTIAEHLLELGHVRMAVASGPVGLTTVADRLQGIQAAARGRGLDGLYVVEDALTFDGGLAACRLILDTAPDTTAILALNDVMAIGVLAGLRERGLRCPQDVSVSGFDDVPVAAHLGPALTTVRLPMVEFGRLALEMSLLPAGRRPRRRHTGHRLVVRDSTSVPAQ